MPEVMAAIDVLASVCTVEAFGRSILEAQASRTPVVAPDLLGVSDIVEDGSTGWLFEPEDVPDLAAALTRLLDSADRARIVEAANHQAKSFGIDGQGKILIDSYRALV
jgi:glycosyltransferase involved in cell wall biosynthesis